MIKFLNVLKEIKTKCEYIFFFMFIKHCLHFTFKHKGIKNFHLKNQNQLISNNCITSNSLIEQRD